MDVKFLTPFVEAAKEVIQAEAKTTIQRGNLSLKRTAVTTEDISVIISLVGEVEGVVIFSLSIPTALKIVSRVIGQDFEEFDDLARSGIAELGNVITGRATMLLAKNGFNSDISPPTLIIGRDVKVSSVDFSRIVVPLIADIGEITVHLSLKERKTAGMQADFIPAQLDQVKLQQANALDK